MSTANIDFLNTVKMLETNNNKGFQKYSSLYSFTTENISGYLEHFDVKNKKILTVLGSGDHIFNLILQGASDIKSFDINLLSYYYFELKLNMINNLKYKGFIDYFMIDSDTALEYRLYRKYSSSLPQNVKLFWDKMYIYFNYDGKMMRFSKLFNNKYDTRTKKIQYNKYLNEDEFLKLKSLLKGVKIKFLNCSVLNIDIKDKFDLIFLSNISDYISQLFEKNYISSYKNLINSIKTNNLAQKGLVAIAYIYDYNINKKICRSEIDNVSLLNSNFSESEIITFESALENYLKDAIIYERR